MPFKARSSLGKARGAIVRGRGELPSRDRGRAIAACREAREAQEPDQRRRKIIRAIRGIHIEKKARRPARVRLSDARISNTSCASGSASIASLPEARAQRPAARRADGLLAEKEAAKHGTKRRARNPRGGRRAMDARTSAPRRVSARDRLDQVTPRGAGNRNAPERRDAQGDGGTGVSSAPLPDRRLQPAATILEKAAGHILGQRSQPDEIGPGGEAGGNPAAFWTRTHERPRGVPGTSFAIRDPEPASQTAAQIVCARNFLRGLDDVVRGHVGRGAGSPRARTRSSSSCTTRSGARTAS